MIEVAVSKLGLDSASNTYVVILKERGGNRLLPIWIGQPEAESIVLVMTGVRRERPPTHDHCRSLILGLGGMLVRVEITKVQKNTYFAELHVARGESIVKIDARPSDSIAIALRFGAPIFADESLLTAIEATEEEREEEPPYAQSTFEVNAEPVEAEEEDAESDPDTLDAERLQAYLETLRPEDFGKFNP